MSVPTFEFKHGNELQVGDVIVPWFERQARVVALWDYRGPLDLPAGTRIAKLAPHGANGFMASGMTIDPAQSYTVVLP